MAKSKAKPTKKYKSFSDMHGSTSPTFPPPVSEQQLGHAQQLPVNPPTPMGSPLINPGEKGHPMAGNPNTLAAFMNYPSGEDFY